MKKRALFVGWVNLADKMKRLSFFVITVLALAAWVHSARADSSVAQSGSSAPASDSGVEDGSSGSALNAGVLKSAWTITPAISLGMIYTDNVNLSSSNGSKSSLVTQISPSINIAAKTKRLKGSLRVRRSDYFYQSASQNHRAQNQLAASGKLELIENWMFVDMTGSISNTSVSPFAPGPEAGYSINSNSVETKSYSISPYVRGHIWSGSEYELRYGMSRSDTGSSTIGKSNTDEISGRLASGISGTKFGWNINYNKTNYDITGRPKYNNASLLAMISYQADPQFTVSAGAVRNENNFGQLNNVQSTGGAFSFAWRPTPLTSVDGNWQRQSYGPTYKLEASHRSHLTDLTYSFSRSITTLPQSVGYVGLGTLYDLFYAQLASAYPDPNERAAAVNNLLALYGLSPNTMVTAGYLQTAVTLRQAHLLSFVIRGVRNILTLSYGHNINESATSVSSFISGLSQSSSITQDQFGITLAHLLSANSNLNLNLNYIKSRGSGTTDLSSTQQMFGVTYNRKLGQKTNMTFGYTRNEYKVPNSQNYNQNVVSALLTHQF